MRCIRVALRHSVKQVNLFYSRLLALYYNQMKKIAATIQKRSSPRQRLSLALAGFFTILAVLQLFWFEDFPAELAVLLPDGWAQASIIVATVFVIGEVLAVAYFLPVALSPLARWCVRACAWAVPVGWIVLMGAALLRGQAANVAYLGAKVDVPLGWEHIGMMLLVLVGIAMVTSGDLHKS